MANITHALIPALDGYDMHRAHEYNKLNAGIRKLRKQLENEKELCYRLLSDIEELKTEIENLKLELMMEKCKPPVIIRDCTPLSPLVTYMGR